MTRRRYVLLGHPIERSPSPAMHNAAFRHLGLDAEYGLRPAEIADLRAVREEMQRGVWQGANITTPLKPHLTDGVQLDELARRAGAINTLWRPESTDQNATPNWNGAITDVEGIVEPLSELQTKIHSGGRGLILGSGGAARAAGLALERLGCEVAIAARNLDRATQTLQGVRSEQRGSVLNLAHLPVDADWWEPVQIIVQATPVGRNGQRHPLPWEMIGPSTIAFEMIYLPRRTPFLAEAKKRGCPTVEGWAMLVAQGAASFRLWTGQQAPIAVMKHAVQEHLQSQDL